MTITIPAISSKNDLIAIPGKEYEEINRINRLIPKEQLWFWSKE